MTRRSAFTLVELVVIILILGILAGVAAPKMFKTSATATDNGLKQTLAIVRDAVELYTAENGGAFPTCTGDGTDFQLALKKYIRGPFPVCPVGPAKNDDVTSVATPTTPGDAVPTMGWKFNTTTGAFICNYGVVSNTPGVNYDAF
jgi:general secretion pathway protein G